MLAGFFAALFLLFLWPAIRTAVPETDSWWMVPTFSYYAEGKGPVETLQLILNHSPKYFRPPVLKAFIWVIDDLFHLPFRFFPAAGAALHLLNAGLLALLCFRLKLSLRIAAAAGLVFLTLFPHFDSYLWLPASQHPYSITTLLALLCLFLATERRAREGKPWRGTYTLAALAALLASLQHSGSIALPVMLCYAWAGAGPTFLERRAVYDRWLPVWVLFLVYPLWAMAFFGDNTVISAVAKVPLSPWVKFAGLMGVGIGALLGIRAALGIRFLRTRGFWLSAAVAAWLLLALRDNRQVLLPYNGLVPLMTALSCLLDPFYAALQVDSSYPYYYIPTQLSVPLLLAAILLGVVFFSGFVKQKKGLAFWGVWYLIALAYLLLHKHVASGMPLRNQSRYFLYVTPVFSVLFACGLVYGLTALARRLGWSRAGRDRGLAAVLLALCVPNLLAIRVALHRGRLVNTYFVYDDYRAAALITEDLERWPAEAPVRVKGLAPLVFRKQWSEPVDARAVRFENFRRILRDRIGRGRAVALSGQGEPAGEGLLYRIEEKQIFAPDGRELDRFQQSFRRGWELFQQGSWAAAREKLAGAARERPFFLNYVLGQGRLTEIPLVSGGMGMRDWLERMTRLYHLWSKAPVEKWERVTRLVEAEMADYLLCLFALSYLEAEAGDLPGSRRWLSQIYFLEGDPRDAMRWVESDPRLGEQGPLRQHARRFLDPDFFSNPVPWRKNDYAAGRFFLRLVSGWDIRSGWDRLFSAG